MLNNVIVDLIAAVIVAIASAVLAWLYKKHFYPRVKAFRKVYGESVALFDNAEKAYPDIEKEAVRSNTIRYFGNYNTTFLRERLPEDTLLYRLLSEKKTSRQSLPRVMFLHLDPSSQFIGIRAKELQYPTDGQEIRNGIITSLEHIRLVKAMLEIPEGIVDVRYHDLHPIFRLILLDDYAYIGFFKVGRTGPASPLLKVSKNSDLYQVFDRFFDVFWKYYSKPA